MPNHDLNLQEVLAKSAVNSEFRSGLLSDPRRTLEDTFGQPVPPNLRLKFVEREPDCEAMFVLPDPIAEEHELTPEELAAVAGGEGGCWYSCGCTG